MLEFRIELVEARVKIGVRFGLGVVIGGCSIQVRLSFS